MVAYPAKGASPETRKRQRIPRNNSRIEPLNLIGLRSSVVGCSVAELSFGAFRSSGLPVAENGSGRRHTYCLVTPLVWCSRWGGLSSRRRSGARRLARQSTSQHL